MDITKYINYDKNAHYYIETEANGSKSTCNVELFASNYGSFIISLYDVASRVKKILADIRILSKINYGGFINIKDYNNINTNYTIYFYIGNNEKIVTKTCADGTYLHAIVYRFRNISLERETGIWWGKNSLEDELLDFVKNVKYIPATKDNIKELLNRFDIGTTYTNSEALSKVLLYTYTYYGKISDNEEEIFSLEPSDNYKKYYNNFDWNSFDDIESYIHIFYKEIKRKLDENIKSLYDPQFISKYMFEGKLQPYKGQIPLIQSGIEVLNHNKALYLSAEMGIGKTPITTWIINSYFKEKNKQNYSVLIVAPAITLTQWRSEIQSCVREKCDIHIIRTTDDFINIYKDKVEKPTFYIVGKETFKLDSRKIPAVHYKELEFTYDEYIGYRIYHKKAKGVFAVCPICGQPIKNTLTNKKTEFLQEKDFVDSKPKKSNYKCSECGAVLWQNTYDKTKKTSLINYIKVKKIDFDMVVVDEAHEGNKSSSIIGNATKTILRSSKKCILLSGTMNNGYASSLHNILMAIVPRKLKQDECLNVKNFILKYGTLKASLNDDDAKYMTSGKIELPESRYSEAEGINPVVFTKYLAENFIFATLKDLEKDLPKVETIYVPLKQDSAIVHNTENLISQFKSVDPFMYKFYEDSIVKHYLNNPYTWDEIEITKKDMTYYVYPQNTERYKKSPKEEKVIEICKKEKEEGRKCWIYTDFTGESGTGQYMKGNNVVFYLKNSLEESGLKVFWLKPNIPPIDRKELIEKNKEKYDVFISNPKLVNVGINMAWCGTYIVYIPSYRVDIITQAIHRGYRANSQISNRIYMLFYENTIENEINKRYQMKLAESYAIEGKFDVELQDENIRTASALSKKLNDILMPIS